MNRLKKIMPFAIITILLLGLAGCGKGLANKNVSEMIQENQKIIWGVKNDTRLFGMINIETGEIEGFDIDIAKAITKEILGDEGKAEFVEVTSKTRIPLLKNGNIDAIIATMTITEERKKQVDFSQVYFDAGQSLLVKKGSPIQSIDDLDKNTTVLAVKGSTSAVNIRNAAPDAKVLEFENYAECFTALKSGQGDAMTTDNSILLGLHTENPNFVLTGGNFTDEPYGIAINKGQEEFLNQVNDALDALHENGTYEKIYSKWFPELEEGE